MRVTLIFSIILFIVGLLSHFALIDFIYDALEENQIIVQASSQSWLQHVLFGCVLAILPILSWVLVRLGFSRIGEKRQRTVLIQLAVGGTVGSLSGVLIRLVFYLKVLLQPPTVEEVITTPRVSLDELELQWWALGGGTSGISLQPVKKAA